MMRKASLILLGAAAGVAVTLVTTQPRILLEGTRAHAAAADYRQLSLFGAVLERVRADYVEKPDDRKLIESAINGMLAGLDPHSGYMDAKSFRNMQVDTRGEASLRGHLKAQGDEQTGSQSYIPPDPKDDKALHTALDLMRGVAKNPAYPPSSKVSAGPR